MEEWHDEVGSVICGKVVCVDDVRGRSEEILVTQRDTLRTKRYIEKLSMSKQIRHKLSTCPHRPVVPLVCKTKATSSGVGSLGS
jgi:hypothetical protein